MAAPSGAYRLDQDQVNKEGSIGKRSREERHARRRATERVVRSTISWAIDDGGVTAAAGQGVPAPLISPRHSLMENAIDRFHEIQGHVSLYRDYGAGGHSGDMERHLISIPLGPR